MQLANAVKSPDIQQRNKQSIVISSDAMSSSVKPNSTLSVTPTTGVSPAKVTELRMKNFCELRELQELLEQNVVTQHMVRKKIKINTCTTIISCYEKEDGMIKRRWS